MLLRTSENDELLHSVYRHLKLQLWVSQFLMEGIILIVGHPANHSDFSALFGVENVGLVKTLIFLPFPREIQLLCEIFVFCWFCTSLKM